MTAPVPARLERALAAMLHESLGTHSRPWMTRQVCPGVKYHEREAAKALATPVGALLAALVEAAEDWLEAKVSTGHATVDLERAVIAWLAATEETRDA